MSFTKDLRDTASKGQLSAIRNHSISTFAKNFRKINICQPLKHTCKGKKCQLFVKFCVCTKWILTLTLASQNINDVKIAEACHGNWIIKSHLLIIFSKSTINRRLTKKREKNKERSSSDTVAAKNVIQTLATFSLFIPYFISSRSTRMLDRTGRNPTQSSRNSAPCS